MTPGRVFEVKRHLFETALRKAGCPESAMDVLWGKFQDDRRRVLRLKDKASAETEYADPYYAAVKVREFYADYQYQHAHDA